MSQTRESIIRVIELLRQTPFDGRLIQDLFSLYKRENLITNTHVQLIESAEVALKLINRQNKEEGREFKYLLLPPSQFIVYGTTPPEEVSMPVRTSDGIGTTFQKGHTPAMPFMAKTFSIAIAETMLNNERPHKGFSSWVKIHGDIDSLTPLTILPAKRIHLNDIKSPIKIDFINQDLEELSIQSCKKLDFSFLRTMPIQNLRKISIDNTTIKTHQIEDLVEFIIFNREVLTERYRNRADRVESPYIYYSRYTEFDLELTRINKRIKLDCLERLKGLGIPIHLSFWLLDRASNPLFSLRDTFKDLNILLTIH